MFELAFSGALDTNRTDEIVRACGRCLREIILVVDDIFAPSSPTHAESICVMNTVQQGSHARVVETGGLEHRDGHVSNPSLSSWECVP